MKEILNVGIKEVILVFLKGEKRPLIGKRLNEGPINYTLYDSFSYKTIIPKENVSSISIRDDFKAIQKLTGE